MVACKFLCFEKTGPWVEATVVQHIVNVQCKQTTNESARTTQYSTIYLFKYLNFLMSVHLHVCMRESECVLRTYR